VYKYLGLTVDVKLKWGKTL